MRILVYALGLSAFASLSMPQDTGACSVCLAGDPVFSSNGATAPAVGDFSLYVEARSWRKTSGVLPGEAHGDHGVPRERNDGRRVDLYLSWSPVDRVSLTLNVPYVFNKITEIEEGERLVSTLSGFGDLSLSTGAVIWRNRPVLPSAWVEVRGMVKLPTGRSSQRVDGRKDPHLQEGTGSWDFGFGLAGVHRMEWGSLYASAFYRENTEGSLDYEYGDIVLGNLGLEVPLGHAIARPWLDRVTAGTELNFRYAGFDEFEGLRYEDSGGAILYITPSLRVRLPWGSEKGPSLRAAVQVPVDRTWLHNRQSEGPVWTLGLHYAF